MTAIITGRGKIRRLATELKYYQLNVDHIIIHSRLKEFEKEVPDSGLSIKLGLKGQENLIVNRHQQFDCYLNSKEILEGFSFYLSDEVIREAHRGLYESVERHLDEPFRQTLNSLNFLESVFPHKAYKLSRFLNQLRPQLLQSDAAEVLDFDEVFFQLASSLLKTQYNIRRQIDQIPSARLSTRKELYRRLCMANQYIHENFTKDIQLEKLARVAMLSKFHLLRTYKQIYGVTPYKQVLHLRLARAKELMKKDYGLEEIAFMLGFSDRRSFTKAFKKNFQVPPSDFRLQQRKLA